MTLRELLALVAPHKLERAKDLPLAAALHDSEGTEAPLLVRLFSAIGTWIGAALIAVLSFALEIYETVPLALALAAGLFYGAIALSRRPTRSLAMTQVIWAMALGAHGLVAGAFAEMDASDETMALTWTALNVATIFLVRVPSFQLVSAVCAIGFATWFADLLGLPMYPLWIALPVAGLATATWILEVPWTARLGRTWSALAYGLPIGVVGPLTLAGINRDNPGLVATSWGAPIATVALLGLIGVVLLRAKQERGGKIDGRAYMLGGVAIVAGLAARHVPGLTLALLWLLVAHLRKSAGLHALALAQLAGFLLFFYYQLETTLLLKSLWVISTGVTLLIGAWLARPRAEQASKGSGETEQPNQGRRSRWLPAIVLALLTCAIVTGASLQKERILARGQSVLLPLAPVDPRSLMQGDYMELRYALEDEMDQSSREVNGADDPRMDWAPPALPDIPRHGRLVIEVDDEGVGHFSRIEDDQPLADDELYLEYRLREGWGGRLRVGAESYFFEEGTGERYESARYGEVVIAEDGESVLVGLRGEDKRPLGARLHEL